MNNDSPQVEPQPDSVEPAATPAPAPLPQKPLTHNIDSQLLEKLVAGVAEQNRLLDENLRYQKSIKERILAGIWQGFGTVIGATVVVGLLIYGLKQIATVEWISPIVNKVIDQMESRGRQPGTKEPAGSPRSNEN